MFPSFPIRKALSDKEIRRTTRVGKNLVVWVNYARKRSEEEEVLLGHVGSFSSLAEKEN